MVQTASLHGTHALGLEFGSAAQLYKRPGSVWNCLWGNALKRSPGIIRKSRVSYPGPGFLSSATWSSLLKKHYNGLNQTKPRSVHVLYTGIYVCACVYIQLLHGNTSGPTVIRIFSRILPHDLNIVEIYQDNYIYIHLL